MPWGRVWFRLERRSRGRLWSRVTCRSITGYSAETGLEWEKRKDWRQGPVRGLFSDPGGESLGLTAAVAVLPDTYCTLLRTCFFF